MPKAIESKVLAPRKPRKTAFGYVAIAKELGLDPDIPVLDATEDLQITVTKADLRKAKPEDAHSCGYAMAICRQLGVTDVWVYRHTTLVLSTLRGKPVLYRYLTTDDMKLQLNRYDLNKRMPEHSVVAKAPTGSYTMERKRERARDYARAVKSGERVPRARTKEYLFDPLHHLRPRMEIRPR